MGITYPNDSYSQYPDHPLRGVSQGVLDTAREFVKSCVPYGDVEKDMAEPIADGVVQAIVEAGYKFDTEDYE